MTLKIITPTGRVSFPHVERPAGYMHCASGTMRVEMNLKPFQMAGLAQMFGRDGVQEMIGYDPQRLLPAPDLYRTVADWAKAQTKLSYEDMAADYRRMMGMRPELGMGYDHGSEPARVHRQGDWPHKVAVIHVTSFSDIEARILATMADKRVRGVILDLDSAGGEIIYKGNYSPIYQPKPPTPPKVKQNGRSAAYLDHDPSKKNRRRK